MPLSVRLDPETRSALERVARASGQSRSSIIREALARYLATLEAESEDASAHERLSEFIGCVDSGGSRRSRATGRGFRRLLEERARARRAD